MAEQTIRLIYPSSMVNVPVIYQLIRSYDVVVNIVGADLSGSQGWIDIIISGAEKTVQNAIAWLESQGIETILITD